MSRDPQALLELYAGRVLEPLDANETDELRRLEASLGLQDDGSLEEAAATVALASVIEYCEPLPEDLRRALLRGAPDATTSVAKARPSPRPRRRLSSGWLAAAACLVLAVFGWSRTPQRPPGIEPVAPEIMRERLLQSPQAVRVAWSATDDPLAGEATGDVVWDGPAQRGFMTFHHFPVNDPTKQQYQLWIFDETRDPEHPVDGGVFDVTGEDAVVPIEAKLAVREPTLFAVTLEPAGGVVVSRREHLLLVATVDR